MEPSIQFTTTRDDVSIAYAVLGEGTPIVFTNAAPGRIHMYARGASVWRLEERLAAAGFQAVIFDGRGMGSSDRRNTDFSLGARMLDLEAVVEAAGIGRFVIAFGGTGATAAATYAGRHRERVSHLVAINPVTAVRDLWEKSPVFRAMRAMEDVAEEEWETFTLMIANSVNDFRDPGTARELADAYRSGMKPADLIAYLRTSLETDPADLFGSIAAPALVVFERTTARERSREVAQRLAQRIPRARFVETDDAARAIADFVGVSGHPAGVAAPSSGMTAILFADIADSTALTERLGDAAFRTKARDLDAALRTVIREHAGTPIEGKLLGDGVLAVFTSARQAIEAALSCGRAGDEAGLPPHLGLHAGDVIREDNNVYGGAVNIASRISGLSAPGEVLVSDTVRSLARTSAGVRFENRASNR